MNKRSVMQSKDYLMRWGILSFLLILSVCILMLHAGALTSDDGQAMPLAYSGGSGTEADPYLIASRDDLAVIADAVNSGEDQKDVYFLMTNDIDLGGKNYDPWSTIGITIDNAAHQFRGVFDGGQFKITGLYVDRDDDDAGLFGYVGEGGVVRNVNIDTPDVSGTYWCGALAGRNYGLIEYCSTTDGYVYGSQQLVGGLVGDNHDGVIRYCYNRNTEVECDQICGGLVGRNSSGTVENCYNTGDVYSSNAVRSYAGGVAGENTAGSTIDNCYSTGYVDGVMSSGAITGANGAGSSVTNCYYPEDCEPGIGGNSGTVENVNPKSDEEFSSGEVAWELSKGNDGEGWGQTLDGDDGAHDNHPHFKDMQDKDYETTAVHRVTFTANTPPYVYNEKIYVDPGVDVPLPDIPEWAEWYVKGEIFDGKNIQSDKDAVAGIRILFGGETDMIPVTGTYSPDKQILNTDMDAYMAYAEKGPSSWGRFEYTIAPDGDKDGLNAELSEDGKTLTIPAGTNVGEYMLTVTAHEKEPYIATLSMSPFGADDVTLTVKVVIEKATPVIAVKPTASEIDFGQSLVNSKLGDDGESQHPTAGSKVEGTFSWYDDTIVPNSISEAASVGYFVTFTPKDTDNYNTASAMVTLTVNKLDIVNITAPTANNGIYNGSAQNLINEGSADGGTMKYWLADSADDKPDADTVFSSTIPSRVNAGTYTVWYKVVGDESHNDTDPDSVKVTISPALITIPDQTFTYNGVREFSVTLNGENNETVTVAMTAASQNAASYSYTSADAAGENQYTAVILSPNDTNYTVDDKNSGKLTIEPLMAILKWKAEGFPDNTLTYEYNGSTITLIAEVTNAVPGDRFDLQYEHSADYTNYASEADGYTAKVTSLGNDNYITDGVTNIQIWRIYQADDIVSLKTYPENIVYGGKLTLTATITTTPTSTSAEQEENETRTIAVPYEGTVGQGYVKFFANGELLKTVYNVTPSNNGEVTASITVDVTSEGNYFYSGLVPLRAEYSGDIDWEPGMDAVTITVQPKPVTAGIDTAKGGSASKVYDGDAIADPNLTLKLEGVLDCDKGIDADGREYVSVTADSYTYNSADADEAAEITADNITLSGAKSVNYTVNDTATIDGTIDPKVVELEWRGFRDLVYTGDPVNVNATVIGLVSGDECSVDEIKYGAETNADSYTASAEHLDNPNYKLPDDKKLTQQEYIIAPAKLYIPERTDKDTYNGTTKFDAEVDGVTPANGVTETVEVKLTTSSADADNYIYIGVDTGNTIDRTYMASTDNTNYEIAGGAMLTTNPYMMYIPEQTFKYNGTTEFYAKLDGVTLPDGVPETVDVRFTTSSADADNYIYTGADTGDVSGKTYRASTDDTNYGISGGGILTITDDPDGNDPNNPDGDDPNNPDGDDPNKPDGNDPNKPDGDDPNKPDGNDPNKPDNPSRPTGSSHPAAHVSPAGSASPGESSDPTDQSGENAQTEDISSNSASYAADEEIGIVRASYAGSIIIISVIAAVVFILKKKYSVQNDRH